jgi:hypothetical protein
MAASKKTPDLVSIAVQPSTPAPTAPDATSPAPAATAPASPPPTPVNPPPPDPIAELTAFVQQTITTLDGVEVGLGNDPPLTPVEKRHAAKLRKGGEKALEQIGNLAQQHQLESPALKVSDMLALLGKASAVQPLADRAAAFGKHVQDVLFAAQSAAWVMGMQYYALLQRRARTDAELAKALAPVTQFLAYRHPKQKAPGTPTKRQKKATSKAVKTLKKAAPELLAPQASAPQPSAQPSPQSPAQPGTPPTASNGAGGSVSPATPTNGASAGATAHS